MLQPGENIDIWVIEKQLGSGGMGSVYRCHNKSAKRILAAVKVLDNNLSKYPEAQARFIREAEILFQLDHPNIVKVRNVRTDASPPYLEMEFVQGESLEHRLKRGAPEPLEALRMLDQISSAVAYLHRVGVRHRDIKPANLLIDANGQIKLVDFGLAMEADTTRITQQGMTFGTVSYAPPEWISPDTMDPAKWDLYSVGVVSYEILTGKVAFPVSGQGSARQQAMQVIVGKQSHEPLDPGDEFDDDLRALVRDMTHADPELRVGTANEIVRRCRALMRKWEEERGITLAPEMVSLWGDGLDRTPPTPKRLDDVSLAGPPNTTPLSRQATAPATAQRTGTPNSGDLPAEGSQSLMTSLPVRPSVLRGGLAAALFALALFSVVAVLIAYSAFTGTFQPRAVHLVVSGLPSGTDVGLRIDDLEPSRRLGDWEFAFDEVPTGESTITWIVGDRCQIGDCPGPECPGWCSTGTLPATIEVGQGEQTIAIPLVPAEPRRVRLNLPEVDPKWDVEAKLDRTTGRVVEGGALFDDIEPGRYTLRVYVGTCSPQLQGCWTNGTCTPECTSIIEKIVVPVGDGEWSHTSDVGSPSPSRPRQAASPAPSPSPAPVVRPEPAPDNAAPKPAPQPTSSEPSRVTVGRFAGWLESQPDWHAAPAQEAGRAHGAYLQGWDGSSPPRGQSGGQAMTGVSWYAAAAYCKSRGGLASTTTGPTTWAEGGGAPIGEYRQAGGRPTWLNAQGDTIDKLDAAMVIINTGFRCSR